MIFESQIFSKVDYKLEDLGKGDYDICQFINCDFTGSDLSEIRFADCIF
ncbi:MAG: hypothetical protein AB9922_12025 [Bacteroidales bacterium]